MHTPRKPPDPPAYTDRDDWTVALGRIEDVDAAPTSSRSDAAHQLGSAIAQGGDAGSRHTPGPWVAEFCDEPLPKGLDRDEVCILPHVAYDAVDIFAPARDDVGPQSCGLPEFEANVRLIAAAPCMFEALEKCCAAFVIGTDTGFIDFETLASEFNQRQKIARAALAKATGEVAP